MHDSTICSQFIWYLIIWPSLKKQLPPLFAVMPICILYKHKTVVTPVHWQLSYHSLVLSHVLSMEDTQKLLVALNTRATNTFCVSSMFLPSVFQNNFQMCVGTLWMHPDLQIRASIRSSRLDRWTWWQRCSLHHWLLWRRQRGPVQLSVHNPRCATCLWLPQCSLG